MSRSTTGRTSMTAPPRVHAKLHLDPTALPTNAIEGAKHGAEIGHWNTKGAVIVTASGIEDLARTGDFSSITPAIPRHLWPAVQAMLQTYSPDGPLGSRGPLSARGPIGNHPWNPSFWFGTTEWRKTSEKLTANGGPGSELGPLGQFGAAGEAANKLAQLDALAKQMEAGGLFAGFGPHSALGPKGPLGFLGAVGGHGFKQDENGAFVGDGKIQRTTDVRYEGRTRTHELAELYRDEDLPKSMRDNDTSWMVRGVIAPKTIDDSDTFSFTSHHEQFVTLTLIPENLSDVFEIELLDDKGRSIAKSDSDRFVNFIQVETDTARKLQVRVKLKKSDPVEPLLAHPVAMWIDTALAPLIAWGQAATPFLRAAGYDVDRPFERGAYRLCVVGSGESMKDTDIRGAHQERIDWAER